MTLVEGATAKFDKVLQQKLGGSVDEEEAGEDAEDAVDEEEIEDEELSEDGMDVEIDDVEDEDPDEIDYEEDEQIDIAETTANFDREEEEEEEEPTDEPA